MDKKGNSTLSDQTETCTICLDDMDSTMNRKKLTCGHEFHDECIVKHFEEFNNDKCPNCNQVETFANIRDIIVEGKLVDNTILSQTSSASGDYL